MRKKMGTCAARVTRSGRLVGNQSALYPLDRILELQLALLQPLDREFIGGDVGLQPRDRGVEIAMLGLQLDQALRHAGLFRGIDGLHGDELTPPAAYRFKVLLDCENPNLDVKCGVTGSATPSSRRVDDSDKVSDTTTDLQTRNRVWME